MQTSVTVKSLILQWIIDKDSNSTCHQRLSTANLEIYCLCVLIGSKTLQGTPYDVGVIRVRVRNPVPRSEEHPGARKPSHRDEGVSDEVIHVLEEVFTLIRTNDLPVIQCSIRRFIDIAPERSDQRDVISQREGLRDERLVALEERDHSV